MNSEKPFQNEEIATIRNDQKPPDSNIDPELESLDPIVSEEELDISAEDLEKIIYIKDTLMEKRISIEKVKEIQDFSIKIQKKYGDSLKKNGLFHALIGSSIENDFSYDDLEGQDSIINFVKNL